MHLSISFQFLSTHNFICMICVLITWILYSKQKCLVVSDIHLLGVISCMVVLLTRNFWHFPIRHQMAEHLQKRILERRISLFFDEKKKFLRFQVRLSYDETTAYRRCFSIGWVAFWANLKRGLMEALTYLVESVTFYMLCTLSVFPVWRITGLLINISNMNIWCFLIPVPASIKSYPIKACFEFYSHIGLNKSYYNILYVVYAVCIKLHVLSGTTST